MFSKYDSKFDRLRLTSTWYEKATKVQLKLVSNTIRNIGNNTCKQEPGLMGYTLPKDSLGSKRDGGVHPIGYPPTKCMEDEEGNELPFTDKARSGHIACNARATNEYASKTVMVHAFNRYPNEIVRRYLEAYNVPFDSDRFALNEMIQWIWRSAIRNDEPITLAILSKRMREDLFLLWLNDDVAEVVPVKKPKPKVVRLPRKKPTASNDPQFVGEQVA
jgi:hypothetical protein